VTDFSLSNPSILSTSSNADGIPADADFELRWTAWKARGRANERIARRRFRVVAAVVAAFALVAAVAYGLLSS
jgi:hypothetical protein